MTLVAAESMTKMLFVVALGLLLLFLGGIILLLGSIAFAFWVKEQTGSYVVGFSSTAGVIFILALLVWMMRRRLLLQPIARLMVRAFLDSAQAPEDNSKKV